jgi:hypothetical protein
MTVVIAALADTERGREILDELEEQTDMRAMQVLDDGTRRYQLDAEDASVADLDPMLHRIDPDWRNHMSTWRDN